MHPIQISHVLSVHRARFFLNGRLYNHQNISLVAEGEGSDHIMFTPTSHERYKEMNPSSSLSFVEVSFVPEATVPATPEFA